MGTIDVRKTSVFVNLRFPALHCWPDAPDEVAFLRTPHRHEFHVRVDAAVNHDDRDIEFILLKRRLQHYLDKEYRDQDLGTTSCETLCKEIMDYLSETRVWRVEVSEDGENGATVTHPHVHEFNVYELMDLICDVLREEVL